MTAPPPRLGRGTSTLRRLDLGGTRRPPTPATAQPCPARRGPGSSASGPRSRGRSSTTSGGAARRRVRRGQRPRSAAAGRRPARCSSATSSTRRRATRSTAGDPARARPGDRQRPPVRRDPATATTTGPRSRPASTSSAAGCRSERVGCYVPGGSAPLPSSLVMTVVPALVAGVERDRRRVAGRPRRARRPGRARGRRPARRRRAPRRRRRPGDRRARVRLCPTARRRSPSTGSSARATPGSRPPRSRSRGVVGIDLPAGPSEGMVLADDDRRPRARRRRPRHPGRARPRLAGDPRHDRRRPRRRRRAARSRRLAAAPRAPRRPRRAPWPRTAGSSLAPDLDAAIAFVNGYAPEHLSIDVARRRGRRGPDPQRRLDLRRPVGAGIGRRLRDRREPRPADRRPRPRVGPARRSRHSAGSARSSGSTATASTAIARHDPDARDAEGLTAHRNAVDARFATIAERARPMSPTPVTYEPPDPAGRATAGRPPTRRSRRGTACRLDAIVRFDLNTSPAPPELAARLLAGGPLRGARSPSTRRRTTAGSSRPRAPRRTASGPTSSLVGAGADEILDLVRARRSCRPAAAAVVPSPTYAMYRVVTEQRGADGRSPCRGCGRTRARRSTSPRSARPPPTPTLVWLCSPNNPTGAAGAAPARSRRLLDGIAADAAAGGREPRDRRPRRGVRRVRRTRPCSRSATDHPNLVVVRTASKAYALAGLRVGFAIAQPETIARIAPYRPPGSRLDDRASRS